MKRIVKIRIKIDPKKSVSAPCGAFLCARQAGNYAEIYCREWEEQASKPCQWIFVKVGQTVPLEYGVVPCVFRHGPAEYILATNCFANV